MHTAKKLIEIFSQLEPDEEVWCIWETKGDLAEIINETEYEDKEGNLIEATKSDISKDFYQNVMSSLDNADYVWERFSEELRDSARHEFEKLLAEKEKAKEDSHLWDIEGEESATSKDD